MKTVNPLAGIVLATLLISGCGTGSETQLNQAGGGFTSPGQVQTYDPTSFLVSGQWIELGPKPLFMTTQLKENVTGRVNCLLTSGNSSIVVGTGSGGLWTSQDGGGSWSPRSDFQISNNIGSLARDPNHAGVLLAGTGESNIPGASADSPTTSKARSGRGILRSGDGGQSWTIMPGSSLFQRMAIGRITFDPGDSSSQRVFVATSRASFGGVRNFGLYLSQDGGGTFASLSTGQPGKLPAGAVLDQAFQPGDPNVTWATVYNAGSLSGVWRSSDGGQSWSQTSLVGDNIGRVALAASATRVYALVGDPFEGFVGLFGSSDQGVTWTKVADMNTFSNLPDGQNINLGFQSSYDLAITISPNDSNTVYVAGTEVCRIDGIDLQTASYKAARQLTQGFFTPDGGAFVGGLPGSPHVDFHDLRFDESGRLLAACDGGVWRLTDPDQAPAIPDTIWENLNGRSSQGLNCIQFYGLAMNPDGTGGWGGAQDNGNANYTGRLRWTQPSSGDGGLPVVEPTDPRRVWLVYNASSPQLSLDGGANFFIFGSGTVYNENEPSMFPSLPMARVVEGQATRVATARTSVYEVLPGADDYVNASNGPLVQGDTVISSLAYAPSNPNVLYAGATDGRVFVRSEANQPFSEAKTGLPSTAATAPVVSGLSVDELDPRVAYCSIQAFDVGHIFKTSNGGQSWVDVSGNLPNEPTNCVQTVRFRLPGSAQPVHILLAGNESGAYYSLDDGQSWSASGLGLPKVPVTWLDVNPVRGLVAAATYGRGAWVLALTQSEFTLPIPKFLEDSPLGQGLRLLAPRP